MRARKLRVVGLVTSLVALGAPGCPAPQDIDSQGNTVEVDPEAEPEPSIPEGVVDDDVANEDQDADGFCFDPEAGYYPCDDGAPPGSGPEGTGVGTDDNYGDPNDPNDPNDPDDPGDPGGGGGAPVCTDQTFQGGTPLPPRILLVVDKSGSMDDDAVGYDGSKWQGAREALSAVVNALDDEVEFGLMLYPDGTANSNVCREGSVEVSVGAGRASQIVAELNATSPGGGTPTASTLGRARSTLDGLGASGGPRVVVLATDGGPNCNESLDPDTCRCVNADGCDNARNCLDDVGAVAAAQALNNAGYPVFVIGIPGSENFVDVLSSLADAGGTAQSGAASYYQANDSAALATSLENIADRVSSCRFDLQGPVGDPANVTVTVGQTTIPRDPTRSFGWDLVDPDTIELFGASCDEASGSPFGVTIGYCFTPGG